MRRRHLLLALSAAALVALTVTGYAFAGNAHFVGTPTVEVVGDQLTASGKVAGLGNIPQIDVQVTADVRCVNPGSKKPKASNKQTVGGGGQFPVQNGKAEFSVTLTATFQPTCTPPMTLEWSNIVIHVTADDGTDLTHRVAGPIVTSG